MSCKVSYSCNEYIKMDTFSKKYGKHKKEQAVAPILLQKAEYMSSCLGGGKGGGREKEWGRLSSNLNCPANE